MNPYNVTGPSNSQVAQVESIVSQRLKGIFLVDGCRFAYNYRCWICCISKSKLVAIRVPKLHYHFISRDWCYSSI